MCTWKRSNAYLSCSIADPNVECSAYSYPPVSSRISSFPPIWQIASILPSDTNAQSKWAGIQPNVPNIPTKVYTTFFGSTFRLIRLPILRVLLRAILQTLHLRTLQRILIAGGHITNVPPPSYRAFLVILPVFPRYVMCYFFSPRPINGPHQPLTMGYGFDDGPNCSHNAFYDFLMSQNQKASTFPCDLEIILWIQPIL